jgi:hypothetical protein
MALDSKHTRTAWFVRVVMYFSLIPLTNEPLVIFFLLIRQLLRWEGGRHWSSGFRFSSSFLYVERRAYSILCFGEKKGRRYHSSSSIGIGISWAWWERNSWAVKVEKEAPATRKHEKRVGRGSTSDPLHGRFFRTTNGAFISSSSQIRLPISNAFAWLHSRTHCAHERRHTHKEEERRFLREFPFFLLTYFAMPTHCLVIL